MLLFFTAAGDLSGMAISLWLASYLLARGFPSRITLRAAVILLALAAYFATGYINLHHRLPSLPAWQAALLTIALTAWYDLTYKLLPRPVQVRTRWVAWAVYAVGLLVMASFIGWRDNRVGGFDEALGVNRVGGGPQAIIYGLFLATATLATLYNFRLGGRVGPGPHSRGTWAASILAACAIAYGVAALVATAILPRLIHDGLLLSAIALLGHAVAARQALVERSTTLQDFPVSALAILGLSNLYALVGWGRGFPAAEIALVTALAILTHSAYDWVREFLDRLLHQRESALRHQLRGLAREVGGDRRLQANLQPALASLCRTLKASGGFVAVRRAGNFVVSASLSSLAVDSQVEPAEASCDDLCQPTHGLAERVAWLAPAFAGAIKSPSWG